MTAIIVQISLFVIGIQLGVILSTTAGLLSISLNKALKGNLK